MTGIRFEWDEAKNISNQHKHDVSFEDASEVFSDPLYLLVADRIQDGEMRWQAFGVVEQLVLLVVHTFREVHEDGWATEIVRIISARRATRNERRKYENQNG